MINVETKRHAEKFHSRFWLFLGALLTLFLIPQYLHADPIPVSGTISEDTTWDDTENGYRITSTVTVQEGVTLTIADGVTVDSAENLFQHALDVYGALRAGSATITIHTRCQYHVGIFVRASGELELTTTTVQFREENTSASIWNSPNFTYFSRGIHPEAGSQVTLDGATLVSLNDREGARTNFGATAVSGATLAITNGSTFQGFRAGVEWESNASLAGVSGDTAFSDNQWDGVLSRGGDQDQTQTLSGLAVRITSASLRQTAGTLRFENCTLLLDTNVVGSNRFGIMAGPEAALELDGCTVSTREFGTANWNTPEFTYTSAAVHVEAGGRIDVSDSDFISLNDQDEARTTFGIFTNGGGEMAVADATSFSGFRAGIRWAPNTDLSQVAADTVFTGNEWDGLLSFGGEQNTSMTVTGLALRLLRQALTQTEGELHFVDCTLQMDTHIVGHHDSNPLGNRHGIVLMNGTSGSFTGCTVQTRELQTSVSTWNDWSFTSSSYAIYADDGASLTIDSTDFTSLNELDGARTTFGLRTSPSGALIVRNASSFSGFRAGIRWEPNSDASGLAADTVFTGNQWDGLLTTGGEQTESVTMADMALKFVRNPLLVSSGELTFTDCRLQMLTRVHLANAHLQVGGGAHLTLAGCTVESGELPISGNPELWNGDIRNYRSSAVEMLANGRVTVDGGSFESLNDLDGRRTTFGISTAPGGNLTVQNGTVFRGFRGGIGWLANSTLANVGPIVAEDCPEVLTPGGQWTSLAVVKGLHVVAPYGMQFLNASLSAEDVTFEFDVSGSSNLNLGEGAGAALTRCQILGRMDNVRNQTASVIRIDGANASFTMSDSALVQSGGEGLPQDRFHYGIHTSTTNPITIRNSVFTGNDIGIHFTAVPETHTITGNDFHGNRSFAVSNTGPRTVVARGNWWGSITGPTHFNNPGGEGDRVTNFVDFGAFSQADPAFAANIVDPVHGQEVNNLRDAAVQPAIELLGLRFVPGTQAVGPIGFRLSDGIPGEAQFDWARLHNFRLVLDANGDGNITGGEAGGAVGGTPSLVSDGANLRVVFPDNFMSPADATRGYVLLADGQNLAPQDAFSVQVDAGATQIGETAFAVATSAAAHRFVSDGIDLSNPVTGQETTAFTAAPMQTGRELLGFRLIGPGRTVDRLDLRLSAIQGFTREKFVSLALALDANEDGTIGAAENVRIPVASIELDGATGLLSFEEDFPADGTYILVGDFTGLVGRDTFTVSISAADIHAAEGVNVVGSASAARQEVRFPYTLAASGDWVPPLLLEPGDAPVPVALAGFQIVPLGREILDLEIALVQTLGLDVADVTGAALYLDADRSGTLTAGDTLVSAGTVAAGNGGLVLRFAEPFTTAGAYLAVADVANRASGDEWTLAFDASGISVPEGDAIIGALPPFRFVVGVEDVLENAQFSRMRWTLDYRSPGGRQVVGAMSQAGDKVVLGYDTGSAWVFDSNSNTPQLMLTDMYDAVRFVGFTQDDKEVVTVTRDGAVNIWDLATGDRQHALFGDLLVGSAGLSPDKTKLLVRTEGRVLLLDIGTKQRLWTFVPGDAQALAVAFSPTESVVVVGASNNAAYLIDSVTGELIKEFLGHTLPVTAVAFSGDGQRLFTGSADGVIQIWRNDGVAVRTISTQGQQSQGAALSPDGVRLAVVTGSSTQAQLRLYNVNNGSEFWAINLNNQAGGHWGGTLNSISFSGTGDRILVTSSGNHAHVASFQVTNGAFDRSWGSRGQIPNQFYTRPRVSDSGDAIFYQTDWGMNLLPTATGSPIHWSSRLTTGLGFDIAADGSRLVWMSGNRVGIDATSIEGGFVPMTSHATGFNYNTITVSPTGQMMIAGDRLLSLESGRVLANYASTDGEYFGAFDANEVLWGFALNSGQAQSSIITARTDDPEATLIPPVINTNLSDQWYNPFKLFFTPDSTKVGAVYSNLGVQLFRRDNAFPEGLYRFPFDPARVRNVEDAALSEDGTLLLIGGANFVALFDVQTGIVLRYFYPQHSGINNTEVRSVQFADHDNLIMIGWDYNYVELYRRSRVERLEIDPPARTLAPGETQEYRVRAIYDDTTVEDVTPGVGGGTGSALLRVFPPQMATLQGGVLTVADGATGEFEVRAAFREGGEVLTARAEVRIGQSVPVELVAEPAQFTMVAGVQKAVRYRVRYSDDYERDVTGATVVTSDTDEAFDIDGNRISATLLAELGDYQVTGTYTEDGVTLNGHSIITVVAPQTEWDRFATTGGGSASTGSYNAAGTHFAIGWSSGSVGLYEVGLSPTQYDHERTFLAHDAPVEFVGFLDDTHFLTAGADGRIVFWDMEDLSGPVREFRHDGAITCAAFDGVSVEQLAVGDTDGMITLYDLALGTPVWTLSGHEGSVLAIAMDGELVLSGGEDWVTRVRNRGDGSAARTAHLHTGPVVGVGFTRATDADRTQHNVIFTVGADRTAVFIRRDTFGILRRLEFPATPTSAYTGGGQLFITTSSPPATWVFNQDGLLLRWLEHPPSRGDIATVLLDPTEKYLLTGRQGGMGSFQFWEVGRGLFRDSIAHSFPLEDARIIGNDRVFTSSEKRIIDWGFSTEDQVVESRRLMETGYFAPSSFAKMDISADGSLVAARVKQSIFLYQPAEDLLFKTLQVPQERGPYVLSPSGARLAEAFEETRLWELANLALVGKESRECRALAFRDDNVFLGIIPPNALGVWDNRAQATAFAQTVYEPLDMAANKEGTRAAVVTLLTTRCGNDSPLYNYYLEVYDVTDAALNDPEIGRPVLVAPPRLLASLCGTFVPDWAIGISQDGTLALVGPGRPEDPATYYRKGIDGDEDFAPANNPELTSMAVRLINMADTSLLREFLPPSGTQAAQAGFSEDNSVMFIAWHEGYAELFERLVPVRLNLGLLRQSETKSAGEPLVVNADSLPAPTVAPGESYRIIATAIFESGKELNVSLASDFALANTPFATLIGNELIVNADAPHGTGLEISAIYTEFDGDPVQKTVRLIVGPGSGFDDFDLDGLPDDWERTHFGDLRQNPEDDPDLDGLTNEQEYLLGTNPKLADTDGDGIPDGEEVANGTDPKLVTPRVTSVAPDRVWLFGDGEAHIAGANFTEDSTVTFAGNAAARVPEGAHSNQDIFVTIPPLTTIPNGAGGEVVVDLDVRHPSNERGSIPFTYVRYLKTQETAVGVTGDVTTSAFFFDRESGSGDRTFVLDGDTPAVTGMLNIPPIADRGTGPVFAMIRATRTVELTGTHYLNLFAAEGVGESPVSDAWSFSIHFYDSMAPHTEFAGVQFDGGARANLTFPIGETDITPAEVQAGRIDLFRASGAFDYTLDAMAFSGGSGLTENHYAVAPPDLSGDGGTVTVRLGNSGAFALRRSAAAASASISVTPEEQTAGAGGGQVAFTVSRSGGANVDWSAEILSGNFLTIQSGSQGQNDGTITVAVAENFGTSTRQGILRVSQSGGGLPIDVIVRQSGTGGGEGEGEGEGELSNLDAEQLESNFAALDQNSDGKLSLEEARNLLPDLSQNQFLSPDADFDGFLTLTEIRTYLEAGVMLSVTPAEHYIDARSQTVAFGVSNNGSRDLLWTATVIGGNFLGVQSGASGMNSGTVSVAVSENFSRDSRQGTLRVRQTGSSVFVDVIVVQDGAVGGEGEGEGDLSLNDALTLEREFNSADADQDGVLTLEEARSILAHLSEYQFDMMDSNFDGVLTAAEIRAYIDYLSGGGGCFGGPVDSEEVFKRLGDLFLLGIAVLTLLGIHGTR